MSSFNGYGTWKKDVSFDRSKTLQRGLGPWRECHIGGFDLRKGCSCVAKISTGSLLPFSNEKPGDGVTMTARELVRDSWSRVTDLKIKLMLTFSSFNLNKLKKNQQYSESSENVTEPRILKSQYLQCSEFIPKCMKCKDSDKHGPFWRNNMKLEGGSDMTLILENRILKSYSTYNLVRWKKNTS